MKPRVLALSLALAATLAGCPTPPTPSVSASPSPSAAPSLAVSASPTASASQAPTGPHNSDLSEQEGCKYLQQGPSTALTATAETATAPEVKSDDRRYDLALPAGEGRYVKFVCPRKAEWSFYTDRDVFLIVQDADDNFVPGARLPGSKFCAEVFSHRVYVLEARPYYLQIESATAATVQLVVEETHPGGAGAGPH